MKYLSDLIEYLESNHHYAQVDEMIKTALDLTQETDAQNYIGDGMVGAFYSDYTEDQIKQLENKIGRIPKNIGIKEFHGTITTSEIIEENLSLIYIAPYINENTDLNTPVYTGSMSLSGMISNRINITQKMPGVHIYEWFNQYMPNDEFGKSYAIKETRDAIIKKLFNIGVRSNDLHAGNFLVQEKVIREFTKQYKDQFAANDDIDINYDLSAGASLFDFGGFRVNRQTPPGQKLIELKNKMNQKNKVMAKIIGSINNIVK